MICLAIVLVVLLATKPNDKEVMKENENNHEQDQLSPPETNEQSGNNNENQSNIENNEDDEQQGDNETDPSEVNNEANNVENELENDLSSNENEETNDEETDDEEVEDPLADEVLDDDNVIETFTGDWDPVGTDQDEPHEVNYNNDSVDREEMALAVELATDIPADDMVTWWVGNGGDQKVEVTVSNNAQDEYYRVYLSWIENKGWKPTRVNLLKENDIEY